jgi:hypothetical protein
MSAYSLEALRKLLARRAGPIERPRTPTLADIPPDAEMDEGTILGFWNGKRFVSWEKWRATAPIEREEK